MAPRVANIDREVHTRYAAAVSARRGPLSLTRLFVDGIPPRDLRKQFLAAIRLRAFQPLKPEDEAMEASGWCVMERPFDLEFDLGNIFEDRYLVLGFRVDRYRIPGGILRAHLAEEEQRLLARTGKNRVSRNERLELRDKVVLRLRRKFPPSTRAIDVVWDLDKGTVLFFSHSTRVLADFAALFEKTFRLPLTEDSPHRAAERAALPRSLARAFEKVAPLSLTTARKTLTRGEDDPREVRAPSEANGGDGSAEEGGELLQRIETTRFLGSEFLLWVWVRTEVSTSSIRLSDGRDYEVWLDRQLTFESPIDKNERVIVRGMAPADSNEAREAVRSRKLPVRARLVFQSPERDFATGLNAQKFSLVGGSIPAVLGSEASEAFLERMTLADELFSVVDGLYRAFLLDRLGEAWAAAWEPAISAWADEKPIPAAFLQKLQPPKRGKRASDTQPRL